MIDFEPKWHASDDQLVIGLPFLEQLGVLQVCRHVDGGFEGEGESWIDVEDAIARQLRQHVASSRLDISGGNKHFQRRKEIWMRSAVKSPTSSLELL
jgi:hypothetical protein